MIFKIRNYVTYLINDELINLLSDIDDAKKVILNTSERNDFKSILVTIEQLILISKMLNIINYQMRHPYIKSLSCTDGKLKQQNIDGRISI